MALDYELTSGINIIIMHLIPFEPIKLTFLLILDVNEGDEWPVNYPALILPPRHSW